MLSFDSLPNEVYQLRQQIAEQKKMLEQLLAGNRTTPESELLTSPQLKKKFKISEPTLILLRKKGLPFILVGNSYRYDLQAVLKFLQKNGE